MSQKQKLKADATIYIRDRRLGRHYTVDNEVYDMQLGVYALAVYNAFSRHASYEGDSREQARTTHRQLAGELLCGVTSVKNGIKTLVEAGLVMKLSQGKGEACIYTLLEVQKQAIEPKFSRRADSEGSQNTPTRTDCVGRQNTPTPGRQAPTRSRTTAKGGRQTATSDKRKDEKQRLSAPRAQSSRSDPYKPVVDFTNRVWSWHVQCAKLTGAEYKIEHVRAWLTVRIHQVGLKRAVEIFEHVANGTKPDIHAFWQVINEEGEASKKRVPKVIETMAEKHPVPVG